MRRFRKLLTMLGAMIALLLGIPSAAADTPDLPTADQVDIPGAPSIVFCITASDATTNLVATFDGDRYDPLIMKATPGFATALEMLLQKKPDGLFMDDNLIGIAPQLRRTTPQKTVIFIQDDGTGTVIKIPTTTTEVYANSAANIWVW